MLLPGPVLSDTEADGAESEKALLMSRTDKAHVVAIHIYMTLGIHINPCFIISPLTAKLALLSPNKTAGYVSIKITGHAKVQSFGSPAVLC